MTTFIYRRRLIAGVATAISLSLFNSAASADITKSIEDALAGRYGAIKFDLNYRYENVNQDAGTTKTANANMARLRLGYLTPVLHDLQAYAEYEGNLAMVDEYNNTLPNGNALYSRIADPDRSELNQFWLTYSGIQNNLIKVGRQRIKFDDDRFIGSSPWRQMETTYDAVLFNNKSLPNLAVNVGYMGRVQTVTGTTENIEAPLLNINYKMGTLGSLVGYGYWLDYTEVENFEKSNQTYGIRATCCDKPLDAIMLSDNFGVVYTAEWSHQSDYGHGPTVYDADRYNLMAGFSAYKLMFQGAMEQLGGSGVNKHFDAPLGSNHGFQGWADLFLITPNNGIRDVFGTVMIPFQKGDLVFTGVYHDYSDDTGRFDYGNEWDFLAVQKFGKHYSVLAKYAVYNAGSTAFSLASTDTQKLWLQANVNF